MANESAKRQIAYKVTIADINEGRYVKEEGWDPNYIVISDGRKVSRANLLGIVVLKSNEADYVVLDIDDGSGKISLRSFGSDLAMNNFEVGDIVLVVGRPREFNEQKYIAPEIIKKLDNIKWIELRKLELQIARKMSIGSVFVGDEKYTKKST